MFCGIVARWKPQVYQIVDEAAVRDTEALVESNVSHPYTAFDTNFFLSAINFLVSHNAPSKDQSNKLVRNSLFHYRLLIRIIDPAPYSPPHSNPKYSYPYSSDSSSSQAPS
jgi:hypothetical protein